MILEEVKRVIFFLFEVLPLRYKMLLTDHGISLCTGNYVAVGTMQPSIEIWDLDIVRKFFLHSIIFLLVFVWNLVHRKARTIRNLIKEVSPSVYKEHLKEYQKFFWKLWKFTTRFF